MVAMLGEDFHGGLVSAVDELADFAVDLFGGGFAIIAGPRDVAAEEDVVFVLAALDHAHLLAHSPFANHPASDGRRLFDVAARAVGDVAENNFLRDASAHTDGETGDELVLAVGVFVFFGEPQGRAE